MLISNLPVKPLLLGTLDFHSRVFLRDEHLCVICGSVGKVSHMIMDSMLWSLKTQGLYLENGVTLCTNCWKLACSTEISCEQLRHTAGISPRLLPEGLDKDFVYDRYGNVIVTSRIKLPGPLFSQMGVKALLIDQIRHNVFYTGGCKETIAMLRHTAKTNYHALTDAFHV